MENVIIGFSRLEQCNAVKEVVISNGYLDITLCQSGAEIIRAANNGAGGIVICGLKLKDMMYHDIYELLPEEYGILVLLSRNQAEMIDHEDIFSLVLPVNKADLMKTVNMVLEIGRKINPFTGNTLTKKRETSIKRLAIEQKEKSERGGNDKKVIEKAKLYLMNKYKISENAAHRFIQKSSMDHGMKMVDTAKIILKDES